MCGNHLGKLLAHKNHQQSSQFNDFGHVCIDVDIGGGMSTGSVHGGGFPLWVGAIRVYGGLQGA